MSAAPSISFAVPVRSASESTRFATRPQRSQIRLVKGGRDSTLIDDHVSMKVVARPSNSALTLLILSAPGYRFRFPIPVIVERSDDGFIVSDQAVNRYGEGRTIDEAAADFRDVLIDYYETLLQNRGRLSGRLTRHLSALEVLISQEH